MMRMMYESQIDLVDKKVTLEDHIQTLEKDVVRDALTGVTNRRGYESAFERIYSVNKRRSRDDPPEKLSIIALDADYFKKVNDTYGHQAGDEVLKTIAQCLKDNTRPQDLIARYGGEEFVIVLPETSKTDAKLVAERIRSAMQNKTVQYNGNAINLTLSLGVADLSDLAEPALDAASARDSLYKFADTAAYQAKHNGRNRVVTYQKGMNHG
jgi:diguanylate cyclase (GGDEF)-like protein